ncbi:MAG: flagellar biosynthesis anti-sigma factor FlgM [Burkholderiaceae bacterium]
MKIGQQPDITPTQAVQATQPATAKAAQGNGAPARNDRNERKSAPGVGVTVSDLARTLEQTRGDGVADVDMDKVNAMRQAIAQNSFSVNPEAIADKLLANAREMLNRSAS